MVIRRPLIRLISVTVPLGARVSQRSRVVELVEKTLIIRDNLLWNDKHGSTRALSIVNLSSTCTT